MRAHWQQHLGLSDEQADELMRDFWTWYVGTLDQPLLDWFAAQRPARLTGILSNSGPGAREAERHWGFEDITDDIVYSHEVGLAKPDPAIYALTAERLGVEPHEIVFLDDHPPNVAAARAAGWHAVHHVDTPTSIRKIEAIIAEGGLMAGAGSDRPAGLTWRDTARIVGGTAADAQSRLQPSRRRRASADADARERRPGQDGSTSDRELGRRVCAERASRGRPTGRTGCLRIGAQP